MKWGTPCFPDLQNWSLTTSLKNLVIKLNASLVTSLTKSHIVKALPIQWQKFILLFFRYFYNKTVNGKVYLQYGNNGDKTSGKVKWASFFLSFFLCFNF